MKDRGRTLSNVLQLITVVVVLVLLVYSVNQSNQLAADRAAQSVKASQNNRRVLRNLENILDNVVDVLADVRATQADQREAFRKLARRNEILHGRDPDEAPEFRSIAVDVEPGAQGSTQEETTSPRDVPDTTDQSAPDIRRPQRRSEPDPRPPRDPDPSPSPRPPPPPPPEDEVCVPLVDVCVDDPR